MHKYTRFANICDLDNILHKLSIYQWGPFLSANGWCVQVYIPIQQEQQ